MPQSELTATIHSSTAAIPAALWNGLVPLVDGKPANPFSDHAFFYALEQSGSATAKTGWLAQHILLSDSGGMTVGLLPLFLKSHSMGEYVFDHAWADAYERAGGAYYPKLQASVPFTPATAPKLLVPSADPIIRMALLQTAQTLAVQRDASSVHATFLTQADAQTTHEAGWLGRVDTQYHWHNDDYDNFDQFLDTLASRKRKAIRRERRDALATGLTVKWLTGSDILEHHWDAFFTFYTDTGSRKWGRPYLTRSFFSLLSQGMADSVLLMLAYDGDTPIAGALNFIGANVLYGRNWGAIRDVPFLHFELCYYQAIDFAIAHKLQTVEAGAQGEHKLARGYVPSPTHSAHWIAHPGLRAAIADYLERERAAVQRDQDELAQFTPFRRGQRGND